MATCPPPYETEYDLACLLPKKMLCFDIGQNWTWYKGEGKMAKDKGKDKGKEKKKKKEDKK